MSANEMSLVSSAHEAVAGPGPSRNGSSATDVLLRVDDLRTWFPTPKGVVQAVDGVSLTLRRGTTLGIVGESGSGKSVLARSIMNLLPSSVLRPSGSVLFDGVDIWKLDRAAVREYWGPAMSMVFQDPMTSLNPVMKIGAQLAEGPRQHAGLSKRAARELSLRLLTDVGIPEPARRLPMYPYELSGGMRQRVCIAAALACSPKLLLADEPTTALDVTIQRQILDLLGQLRSEHGMAMILITHNLGVVSGHSDEIAVMYAGRIVEIAPTKVLFREVRHPYTAALLGSIPRLDNAVHSRLRVVPGLPPTVINPPPGCRFAPRCPNAQERCLKEDPMLEPGSTPGHSFACFYPVGTPEGEAALSRNRTAGRTPAGLELTSDSVEV